MKLLIYDDSKITYNSLPSDVQGSYVIDYISSNDNFSELITLEAVDGVWNITGNKNTYIYLRSQSYVKAPLIEYTVYDILFSIFNKTIKVVSVPDNESLRFLNRIVTDRISIGQSQSCTIRSSISTLKEVHAYIDYVEGEYILTQADQSCFVYVNNRRVTKYKLKFGDIIFIECIKIIWMNSVIAINNPNNSLSFSSFNYANINLDDSSNYTLTTESERNMKLYSDNEVFFHTPKIKSYIKEEKITIEPPPEVINNEKSPIILTIGSSALMGVTSCFTGLTAIRDRSKGTMDDFSFFVQIGICLIMLVSSVLLPIITEWWQRRQEKKREKLRQEKYHEYLDKNKATIEEIIKKQETLLREKHLTLDEIVNETKSNGYNLWSREVVDKDFLTIRLGVGTMPAYITIDAPNEQFSIYDDKLKDEAFSLVNEEKLLRNVPIVISMVENRITPIVVQNENYKQYIDNIMLQLMFYYSSIDLKMVVLTNENNSNNLSYLKYCPHCWSSNREVRFYSSNESEASQLSLYLEQIYNKRFNANGASEDEVTYTNKKEAYKEFDDYYLIITDDFKSVKDLSIINRIINSETNVGFSLLVFSNSLKNLPSRLEKFIVVESGQSGVYSRTFDNTNLGKFTAEYLNNYDINQLTLKIANIPLPVGDGASLLPKTINFLELYNVGKIEHLNIISRWKTNTPMTSLNAPIGFQANNKQIGLDLHEKAHGPHGLIAGSTGSGKSEFIITYILSMAVNYHPYEVQFVLIDYKGGGLAGAFENREKGIKIPHLIGTITNLDKSEMNRTLVSVKSELERRQRKFNEAREALDEGTIDIYKYQRLYREGKVKEPISHLFIISDEFAELKQQQPDFMDELVSTARIGRSLGVHLILATQKPAGIVNDQIWSNSRFKICLKVQTAEDSIEILKKDDASKIKETGRFYLQVGNDELFELGQSAWSGDKYYPTEHPIAKIDDSIDVISNDGTIIKSINDDAKQFSENKGEQLTNIVQYLYDLAIKEKIKFNSLWLPNIPDEIYLGNIVKKYSYTPVPFKVEAIMGEYDRPSNQEQGLYSIPLTDNVLVFGGQGSGKENYLSTFIYSCCILHSPSEVNFYILDFGSEALSVFNKMPHVGSFVTSEQKKLVYSVLSFVESQIQKRKNLFADYQGSYKTYCEKSGKTLPVISVIVNSYEGFRESCDDYDDFLTHLIREGSKYGIIFVLTAVSTNAIRSSLVEMFNNKVILQAQDPFDYQFILGAPNGMIPKKAYGRGITIIGGSACEFQTLLINNRDDIPDTIKSGSKQLMDYYKYKAPEVKIMPSSATFDDLSSNVKLVNKVPLGYYSETSDVFYFDFTRNKNTLFIGNGIMDDSRFMCTIIDLLDNIKNIKLNILDISCSINTDGNASYYNSDFIYPLNEIATTPSDVVQINIIIGIGYAKDLLSEEENTLLCNLLSNGVSNNYFVLFDNYNRFEELNGTPLYSIINNSLGFWFGDGIDEQTFFKINDLLDYDAEYKLDNKVYYIENGNYILIKGIGYSGGNDLYE